MANTEYPFNATDYIDLTPEGRERRTKALLLRCRGEDDEKKEWAKLFGILNQGNGEVDKDRILYSLVYDHGMIANRVDYIRTEWRLSYSNSDKEASKERLNHQAKSHADYPWLYPDEQPKVSL